MKQIVLILLSLTCNIIVSAQVFKGKIITIDGEPVPNATLYIHENTLGIVADEQGKFQTKLKTGVYTCEIRSMGFESQTKTVEVKPGANIQIVLTIKPLRLKEVIVTPSKENPAYQVMRHAISRAPFHLYQISNFTSENYLKGSARIDKIPSLIKLMIKDKKMLSLIGKLMVLESQNEITYQSPSTYTQKVIAYKSSIPKEMEPNGGIRIPTSSIYQPFFMDEISPLSPQAFHYYQFKLEDIFTSGIYQVNKIKVTPKVKSGKLFVGYIYILEDNWSVYSLDLTENEMGTTTRTKIEYQEVKPSVLLPITYDMQTNIGTMGVKGSARFYSSVKYKSIKLNESAAVVHSSKTATQIIQPASKQQQKLLDKIDELSSKDKISMKEALKLARLTTSVFEPKEVKESKESIEIKEVELVKMVIDSLATKRDSTFWEDIRTVPLRAEEAVSLSKKDTSQVSNNVKATSNSVEIHFGNSKKSANLWAGGLIQLGNSINLYYDGLFKGLLKEYNFVDGFWLGQSMSLNINTTKTTSLIISPSAYYSTARKLVNWNLKNKYQYAPLLAGQLSFAVGNTTEDVQRDKGYSRLYNSFSSLFFGDNIIRFYQRKFLTIENQIDIVNGLRLTTGVSYENRESLVNQTNFHFFGITPLPNYPNQAYLDAFPAHSATTAWMKMEYTPFNRYKIKDGKKIYVSSLFPTFALNYIKAIPLLNITEQASYDKINLSIKQNFRISEFDNLYYNLSFGTYFTKQKLYAPDFNYFETNPLFITIRSFDNSFELLDNYSSSNSQWVESHLNWTSEYLFLKRIGFLQTYLFNESLHFHLLWSEQVKTPYAEAGYSIGFNNFGRIGVFTSFNGIKYKNVGIKVSFPIFSLSKNK